MNKKNVIIISFLILNFLYFNFASAQSVNLVPQTAQIANNATFSLTLNIASASNLFGMAFDLNFNPSLLDFISATEGNFLNQGCQTSLMTAENPAGKLIFGFTRLGAACGGVSGSGTLATLNFQALNQLGTASLTFSNNSLCILSGSNCNYIAGTWAGAAVTVATASDTTPPAAPTGVTVN